MTRNPSSAHTSVSCSLLLLTAAGTALAHNHLTVDTASGKPGDQIVIRAGYLPTEAGYTIDEKGRLLLNGEVAVYDVPDQLTQGGQLHNWYAGDELLLTSDYFYSTGRLEGGNFQFELADIAPVSGGPGVVAWGDFRASGLVPSAFSDGDSQAARSFDVHIAGHDHAQGYAFSAPGLYDVTVVAWDSNGVYLDSEPVVVRFQVGTPTCPGDFDHDGFVTGLDFDLFVAAYEAGDLSADFDGDGFITGIDFDLFVGAFEAGC